MDLKSRISEAIRENGGRIPCNQLISLFSSDYFKDAESKLLFKKAVSTVGVVEYGEDKKRFVVLRELARNKENVTVDQLAISQSTQTPNSLLSNSTPTQKQDRTPMNKYNHQAKPKPYSTYTGSEPRQWWIASAECRHSDMSKLLGLNPKLVNRSNPIDGWTALHYASKFANAQCMRLLLDQYKANVNACSRNGQTPLHVAVIFSQPLSIRLLVEEFRADVNSMDFSGRLPISYLREEQRPQFEKLLTSDRMVRIRDALSILRPRTDLTVEHRNGLVSFLHPTSETSSFKAPDLPRHIDKSVRRDTSSKAYGSLTHRSSTLRSNTGSLGVIGRQGSVLLSMLHSAANAPQNDPFSGLRQHGTLPARTIPPCFQESNSNKTNGAKDPSSLESSTSSELGNLQTSLVNRVVLGSTESVLTAVPYHQLPKRPPKSADPETLAVLLSLLPSTLDEASDKGKKVGGRTHWKVKKPSRSPSSHSLVESIDKNIRPSLSQSAQLAGTDLRALLGRRTNVCVQRKHSTGSLYATDSSAVQNGFHLRTQTRCRSMDYGIVSK